MRRTLAITMAALSTSLIFAGAGDAIPLERNNDWCMTANGDMSASCGGGSCCAPPSSYQTQWSGSSYTEQYDSFKRYQYFAIQPDAGRQTATLAPLPARPATSMVRRAPDPSDLAVETEMLSQGLSRQRAADIIRAVVLDDPRADTAANSVLAGQYNSAVQTLVATQAVVILWCGPVDATSWLPWILGLPAPTDCGGSANPDAVLHVDLPCPRPSDCVVPLAPDPGTGLRPIESITLRFRSMDADLVGYGAATAIGFQYREHSLAAFVSPDKAFSIQTTMTALTTQAPKLDTTWSAGTTWTFNTSNRFYYNRGSDLTVGRFVAITPSQSMGSFRLNISHARYVEPGGEPHWRILLDPLAGSTFGVLSANLDLAGGQTAEVTFVQKGETSILPTSTGLEIGYQRKAATTAGVKHDIIINTRSAAALYYGEIKLTYRKDSIEQHTTQFVGMPPKSRIRTDLGDGGDGSASVDLSKESAMTPEGYRTVDISGAALPLHAHFKNVARARVATGPDDRTGADLVNDGARMLILGVAAWQAEDLALPFDTDALVDGIGGGVGGVQAQMRLEGAFPSGTWSWSGPAEMCKNTCAGPTSSGALSVSDNAALNVYFWNIHVDADDTAIDQLPLTACRPKHLDGSCH